MNERGHPPARSHGDRSDVPALPLAAADRERAVERLRVHYVRDDIDVDMYERLLDSTWSATTTTDLDRVLTQLPALPEGGLPTEAADQPTYVPARAAAGDQKEHGYQVAILGGSERKGSWVPPKKMRSVAIMGGIGLDFREARLAPGVTEVDIVAFWGGAEVIVPPGLHVETSGVGILGGFDGFSQSVPSNDPSAPILRIRGVAVMGGIEVKMMLPGETDREARRRVKEDRRRRRLERGGG